MFGSDRTGQLRVVPDVTHISPQRQRRQPATLWQSYWAGVSSLVIGAFQLVGFGGHGRGPWWLHLVIGGFFIVVGLVNLGSALKRHRNRRRLADSERASNAGVNWPLAARAVQRRAWWS